MININAIKSKKSKKNKNDTQTFALPYPNCHWHICTGHYHFAIDSKMP